MFRLILLAVASVALRVLDFGDIEKTHVLPLSKRTLANLIWSLKWGLPCWVLVDLNSTLNRWAENNWIWRNNQSAQYWQGEVAVVTGGSAGIGACVVKELVLYGMKVAVLDVAPLSESFTTEQHSFIRYYKCDITSRDEIRATGESIRSDLGSPSVLVNNAGIGNAGTILSIRPEKLKKVFDINLLSHWYTVQEFLPGMLSKRKGHIMSVASIASFVALAGAADYCCTKAALLAFHEALTQELKHRYKCPQIKTSIVHPFWTKSAITSHSAIEAGLKRVKATLLEPEDVARAMVRQIVTTRSGQLVLGPRVAKIRALPIWIQEIIRDSQANVVTGEGSTD